MQETDQQGSQWCWGQTGVGKGPSLGVQKGWRQGLELRWDKAGSAVS